MAFQDDPPKIYPSKFKQGKVHTITLLKRGDFETKNGPSTKLTIQSDIGWMDEQTEEKFYEATMWISHPGNKFYDESKGSDREYAFLESISGVFEGGQFKIERGPNGLMVGGEGTTAVAAPAAPAPQPPAPAPMPVTAVKSASPIGAVLDQCALMKFLWAQTEGDESIIAGERTDTVRQPLVSTLFIQACREGYDKGFRQWLEVAKAGNAPQVGEDGLPF